MLVGIESKEAAFIFHTVKCKDNVSLYFNVEIETCGKILNSVKA